MASTFDIIEYMSGMTGFVLDESILRRIAIERGVSEVVSYSELGDRDKDLIFADILMSVYFAGYEIPSFQHQHGQFSTSIGKQTIKDKDSLLAWARRLYRKWGDEKEELIPTSDLSWMF